MKAYVKPELFYERYELSKHIADCAWELKSGDQNSCHATWDENWGGTMSTLFTTTASCEWTTDNGVYNDYCYTNGAAGVNVFKS